MCRAWSRSREPGGSIVTNGRSTRSARCAACAAASASASTASGKAAGRPASRRIAAKPSRIAAAGETRIRRAGMTRVHQSASSMAHYAPWMALLLVFAVIAGAGTALSPCALPILPALLSAGATGGRRRPLGVVVGLSATFSITIIGLAEVAHGVGVGDGTLRAVAIVFLLAFGLAVAVPAVAARLEAPLSRLVALGPRTPGDGFVSGLGVGAALGFVYAPCAGPILAAVVSVSAASGRTVAVGLAYTLGAAVVLLALSFGGRRIVGRLRGAGRGPALQGALGAVM